MMLPNPDDFAAYVHKLAGIENHHHVVIYDNSERFGLFSAPRCWYLFRVMGHEFVHIVDGGLPKWIKDGFETASGDYSKAEELPGIKFKFINPKIQTNINCKLQNKIKYANAKRCMVSSLTICHSYQQSTTGSLS